MAGTPSPKVRKRSTSKHKRNTSGLKRGGGTTKHTALTCPQGWNVYAIEFALTGNKTHAAAAAGYHPRYSTALYNQPVIQERIKEIRDQLLSQELEHRRSAHVITVERLDRNLLRVVEQRKSPHASVAAIKLGYQKEGVIAGDGTAINISAQGTANAGAQAGVQQQTTYEVFKSNWKIKQEMEMAKRAQAEIDAAALIEKGGT